ncbi:hypothetical protein LCGC14_0392430 [marine sediment metagenome]|uniref:Uncharacterized protein n=1 Tax=marine sediment metagenome TaxID=412755 RepID=A0A0F9T572_9ZZZZ
MISSGETAKATTDDTVVALLAAIPDVIFRHIMVLNEGANPGFFQIGAGGPFIRVAAGSFEFFDGGDIQIDNQVVNIKRPAGGPNMAGVFGFAW